MKSLCSYVLRYDRCNVVSVAVASYLVVSSPPRVVDSHELCRFKACVSITSTVDCRMCTLSCYYEYYASAHAVAGIIDFFLPANVQPVNISCGNII